MGCKRENRIHKIKLFYNDFQCSFFSPSASEFFTCMKSIFVWNIFHFFRILFKGIFVDVSNHAINDMNQNALLSWFDAEISFYPWCISHFMLMKRNERTSEQTAGVSFKEIHLHLISHKILQWIINEWSERKSDTHWKRVLRWGP